MQYLLFEHAVRDLCIGERDMGDTYAQVRTEPRLRVHEVVLEQQGGAPLFGVTELAV